MTLTSEWDKAQMDAAIRKALEPRNPAAMMPKSDRAIFIAGMRAAADFCDECGPDGQDIADSIRRLADKLER